VWRLFSVAVKIIHSVSFNAVSKSCAKAFGKQKTPARLLKNSRLRVALGCLGTVQSRDKLAFWSGIKSGLFFKADLGGRGEY
jgi:hypothetical protein